MARRERQHFQDESSNEGKRQRTRALILDTSIKVFAEKGIDAASVFEITELAGISNGSFYYHFRNKGELVDAVGGAVAATLVREVDEAMTDVTHGADRVALGSLLFITRGIADPGWGRLIVRALADLGEFREQISLGIRKDILIGIEQGHFHPVTVAPLIPMLLGVVATAMRESLDHPRDRSIAPAAADAILRVLGISRERAASFVQAAMARLEDDRRIQLPGRATTRRAR